MKIALVLIALYGADPDEWESPTDTPLKGAVVEDYKFEFESFPSKSFRNYRVRALPEGGPTPIKWTGDKELFVSGNVKRRTDGYDKWAGARLSLVDCKPGTSVLKYGVNKDEFSRDVRAYLMETDPNARHEHPLTSSILGEFTDRVGERSFDLDLSLTCSIDGVPGNYTISFSAFDDSESETPMYLVGHRAKRIENAILVHWLPLGHRDVKQFEPIRIPKRKADNAADKFKELKFTIMDRVNVIPSSAALYFNEEEIARFGTTYYGMAR